MWISARDQARFGYLTLRNGRWQDRQILSEEWIAMAKTPGALRPNYGFMNWGPNTGRRSIPSAPETAFTHSGAGINRIYVDPDHDLVVVIRWIDGRAFNGFIERVLAAVEDG
jgi:CubicO group peptidase (beta-lactamase class C family)